jgi:hypothetical protein
VLVQALFVFGDGSVVLLADVVDKDHSVLGAAGN